MSDPDFPTETPPLLSSPPPERRVGPVRWWIHLLLIGGYPLTIGILSWRGAGGETHGPALSSSPRELLFVCAVELLIFGVVFGLAWAASRASRDDLLLRWRNGFWTVPLGIGYSVALRVLILVAILVVSVALTATRAVTPESLNTVFNENRPQVENLVDVSAMSSNQVYFWLNLTLVSFVLGGFREELWRSAFLAGMRGLGPKTFGSRAGQMSAAAIAAVLFGFGHLGQGPIAVCLTALLGFGLGAIMVFHRSIWPAVVAHGVFDATSLALLPWIVEKLHDLQKTIGH